LAELDLTPDSSGVIFAHGSRFGGHAPFVKDGAVTYAYNFLGIPPEKRVSAPVPTSGPHVVGVEFTEKRAGEYHEAIGGGIRNVVFDIADDAYIDVERQMAAAMARD